MTTNQPNDPVRERQHLEQLMMAALDDELAEGERAELEIALERDSVLRAEWNRLQRLQEVTRMTRILTPADETWGGYWESVYNRLERGTGWLLAGAGALVLALYGLWSMLQEMMADTSLPGFVKVAVFCLVSGLLILSVSALREKLFTHRHDPYKEIER